MRAHDIAHFLMTRPKKNGPGWLVLCPVHGDRHPSLSIRDGEGGKILVKCFAGCDPREVLKTLREMGLLDGENTTGPILPSTPFRSRVDLLNRLWEEARQITPGGIVDRYMASRGIVLQEWPQDLREHSSLAVYEDGKRTAQEFPALLAVIRNRENRPAGLHITFLKEDGSGKAGIESPRRILGVREGSTKGGAVRLMEPRNGEIGLSEGLETAISVQLLYGEPCWSCISAHGMAGFNPPEDVSTVRIFADRDPNRAGLKAALALATTLRQKGKAVRIFLPDHRYGPKADFNDILTRSANREVKRNLTHATV